MTTVRRRTLETEIEVTIGAGSGIDTGNRFRDHMLETLARYAGLSLQVTARGDLPHHLSEDLAIALGSALALQVPAASVRYGHQVIPMDDALVEVALDAGGRAYYQGALPSVRWDHFLRSLCDAARFTVHVRVLRGHDRHHVIEAALKALGLCIRQALATGDGVFSTKGKVELEVS